MNVRKRVFALLLILICLASYALPVFAHDAYFLSITIDPATMQYTPYISYEDTGFIDSALGDHAERKLNAIFAMSTGWSDFTKYKSLVTSSTDQTEALREYYLGTIAEASTYTGMIGWDNDSDARPEQASMAFTFPGWHPDALASNLGSGATAAAEDQRLAERVVTYAVDDLNRCLMFIRAYCCDTDPSLPEWQVLAARVATCANNKSGSIIFPEGGTKKISFSSATDVTPDNSSGIYRDYYVKVTITDTNTGTNASREFCYRCPKGYYSEPESHKPDPCWDSSKTSSYLTELKRGDPNLGGTGKDPKFITWSMIVMQGNYNSDVMKVNFATLEDIVNPGVFTSLIGELVKWAVTGLSASLQLKPYEDFFLMRNLIASEWVYGMFPSGWVPPILLMYSVCLTLAMSLIGFSILKILWKKQLSTVNIGEKIAMQESIKNLIVTLFLFFAFIPVFIFLAGLNAALVQLFASAVTKGAMETLITISYVSFGSIVLGVAELILKIYFNFFYVTRGLTIAVLVAVSPLAIYALSLGGKTSGVFTAFVKELISQIFVQTIHALIAAFFFNALSFSSMTAFEKLVVLYAFIPLTKFIKTKVFQLSEGPAGQVASTGVGLAAGALSGAASGIGRGVGGQLGRGGGGKGADHGGGGHGGGGGGLGSGEGLLSGTMDRAAGQQRSNYARTGKTPTMSDGGSTGKNPGYSSVYASAPKNTAGGVDGFEKSSANAEKLFNTSAMDKEAYRSIGKTALRGAGNLAGGALYAGMALGMGAVGENPTKYAEMSAKHGVSAAGQASMALYDDIQYGKEGGIRDQQIAAMESAGITGITTNGAYTKYNVNSSNASEHHKSIYEDIEKAFNTSSDPKIAAQQAAAQQYYRDNYGIRGVAKNPTNGNAMTIDMENAKMEAHRISTTDPFEQMKGFKWKTEDK